MPEDPSREPGTASPPSTPAPQNPLPPLLEYPSRRPPPESDTEKWSDFFRALLIVFGTIALLLFSTFGLCGLLGRGCG